MLDTDMRSTNQMLPPQLPDNNDSIKLLDGLVVVAKRKKMIVRITVAAFVISIAVSLLLPKIYSATALILPPQQDTGLMGALMGQTGVGGMASLAGDLLGKGSPADMYVSILSSNAVSDAIIDRFHMMKIYDKRYRLDTYKALDKNVNIAAGKKDGIISITVEDKDPKRAADIANAYVAELARLIVRLNITGAGQNRIFYEERLAKARVDLARAEDGLKQFQSKNMALDIKDQARATIEGIAQLRAQLAMQEVQLETQRQQFTDSSQEVKTLKAMISNIKSQILRLEGNSGSGSIPGAGSVPALGQEYVRHMREFKIQEAIVELLTKQYEMTKLNEAKDVAGVQVIQAARVPDKKNKPKRTFLVLLTTVVAFTGSNLAAFILEYKARMPEEERQRWSEINSLFRGK